MQVAIAYLSKANQNERIDSQFFRPEFVENFNTVADHVPPTATYLIASELLQGSSRWTNGSAKFGRYVI